MQIIKIITLTLIIFLSSCGDNDNKINGDEYTRSECITKTELFIDKNITKKEWREINNTFYTAIDLIYLNKNNLNILIPSIRIPLIKTLQNVLRYQSITSYDI